MEGFRIPQDNQFKSWIRQAKPRFGRVTLSSMLKDGEREKATDEAANDVWLSTRHCNQLSDGFCPVHLGQKLCFPFFQLDLMKQIRGLEGRNILILKKDQPLEPLAS